MAFAAEDLKTILTTYDVVYLTVTKSEGVFEKWDIITVGGGNTGYIVKNTSDTLLDVLVLTGTMATGAFTTDNDTTTSGTVTAVETPVVDYRLIHDDEPASHSDDGEVVIGLENLNNETLWVSHKHQDYRVGVSLHYDSDNTSTKLTRLMDALEYKVSEYNKRSDRAYLIKRTYQWEGNTALGIVLLIFNMRKEYVVI